MTSDLRQREPRIRNENYLAWLRKQPCCVSGLAPPSDPCHIRSGSIKYGKRSVGGGEKPDDQWCLPMNRTFHTMQHSGAELSFWETQRIDPFALSSWYYTKFLLEGGSHKETKKRKSPKIKSNRKLPKGRKLASRGFRK